MWSIVKVSVAAKFLIMTLIGMAVLVHGAEGFDSTLLVTSLAQVLLDADARTLRGYLNIKNNIE